MSEEELEEQIIQQIEVLVDELGGTMCQSTSVIVWVDRVKL